MLPIHYYKNYRVKRGRLLQISCLRVDTRQALNTMMYGAKSKCFSSFWSTERDLAGHDLAVETALFSLPARYKYDTVSETCSCFFCSINWICSLGVQGQGNRGEIIPGEHRLITILFILNILALRTDAFYGHDLFALHRKDSFKVSEL